MRTLISASVFAAFMSLAPTHSEAAVVGYTSSSAFAAATSSLTSDDYSAATAGQLVPDGSSLNGVTYTFNTASGLGGAISSGFYNSISGNSLVAKQTNGDVSASDFFLAGESLTITLPTAVTAFGIFSNTFLPATLSLSFTGGSTVANVTTYDTSPTIAFIGLTSTTAFDTITFTEDQSFNIAEIQYGAVSAVPLPASAPMFGAALLGLAGLGYAAKRKKAAAAV